MTKAGDLLKENHRLLIYIISNDIILPQYPYTLA